MLSEANLVVKTEDIKMLRETLCLAQHAISRLETPAKEATGHMNRLTALIRECDKHRPLGPNDKHGTRHTDTCGCDIDD